jgi:hypothetical protein
MNGDSPLFDLSQMNFDEFVSLFFNHDVATDEFWQWDPDLANPSYLGDKGVAAPHIIVEHMTRLFTDFAQIASKFSLSQINAGIWAMFGPHPFVLHKYLWFPTIPLAARAACIRSMYCVYSNFVSKSQVQVMENCFSMWWDFVATGFWEYLGFIKEISEGDVARLNLEQRALLDSMFDTLSKILVLPDDRTQGYALHGLGHLHHPDVPRLVQNFLDKNRSEMSDDGIRWVEQCRDGTVM